MVWAYIMSVLTEILSSRVRAEVFRLLFGTTSSELHLRELERRSGCVVGTIQTEMKKLERLDPVRRRKDGNRLYYSANREHPLFPEIQGLVLKSAGLVDVLRAALVRSPKIEIAFVFGSVARREEKAESDIDLMVIGQVGQRELARSLAGVAGQLGREINPHVLSVEEFIQRKLGGEHFVTQVLGDAKLFVKGTQHDLEKLG